MGNPVVFTDLDGTLLDLASYSWEPALPALQLLRTRGIPLVLCSSKTRAEIEYYRRQLDNKDPFVSENGGGIFIPEGYFLPSFLPTELVPTYEDGYVVIRLGASYTQLRNALRELQGEGFALHGFGDMSATEVAQLTGLPHEQAVMARQRDFDEPFVFSGSSAAIGQLDSRVQAMGLKLTRGTFFHLLGNSDKGRAVRVLAGLFSRKLGAILTIALGDSPNDLAMLQQVDCPVAVKKPDGNHDRQFELLNLTRTRGVGPNGWNEAILQLLESAH